MEHQSSAGRVLSSQPAPSPLDLGRQTASTPQLRMLHGVHETFARSVTTSLSTFLRAEIQVSLGEIVLGSAGDLRKALPGASCFISLMLHPRQERMVLQLESRTVFSLLELLLGATTASAPTEHRELTDIESSLLEEIVRVVVRPLGEVWQPFLAVEFEMESLGADPTLLPFDPPMQMVSITFDLVLGGQTATFKIVAPQVVFGVTAPAEQEEKGRSSPHQSDFERNLAILESAEVELEVTLQGPKLEFKDLIELKVGEVLIFDYSLEKPLDALVNGSVTLLGHIVGSGRRRAFQIEQLP